MKKESGYHFFGFMYALCMLAFASTGFALSNIFYFWIEDVYGLIPEFSFPLGKEYAVSLSCALVMVVVFFICYMYLTRAYKKIPDRIKEGNHKLFLKVVLFVFLIAFIIYITSVVYGYFSGKNDFVSLLKILVMLVFTGMGAVFSYAEARFSIASQLWYRALVAFVMLMGVASGVGLTMKYSPPSMMRSIYRDQMLVKHINDIARDVEKQHDAHGSLPKTISGDLEYRVKDGKSFQLCATFESDPKDGQRIRGYTQHKAKGKNCFVYVMKKAGGEYSTSAVFNHVVVSSSKGSSE